MSNGPEREMTLDECLERLPEHHAARKELASLRAEVARYHPALTLPDALGKEAAVELAALRAGVEQWQENKAEVERLRKANAAQAKMLDDMEHTVEQYEALEAEVLRLRSETVPASAVAALERDYALMSSGSLDMGTACDDLRALLHTRFAPVRMVPVEALGCIYKDGSGEIAFYDLSADQIRRLACEHAVTVMVRKEDGDV